MERDKISRRKDYKTWYLKNRKSKKPYKEMRDYCEEIKCQKDGMYVLLRKIKESKNDDKEWNESLILELIKEAI